MREPFGSAHPSPQRTSKESAILQRPQWSISFLPHSLNTHEPKIFELLHLRQGFSSFLKRANNLFPFFSIANHPNGSCGSWQEEGNQQNHIIHKKQHLPVLLWIVHLIIFAAPPEFGFPIIIHNEIHWFWCDHVSSYLGLNLLSS